MIGVLALWLARLSSRLFKPDKDSISRPTDEQREELFKKDCTNESVVKPPRDLTFYILRLLGIGYLTYFVILLVGLLGTAPYPDQLRDMLDMTYLNPALMINSLVKLSLMFIVLFIGAYNRELRWYCLLIVLFAHFISTIASVGLYMVAPAGDEFSSFLLMSAIIDGVVVIIFGALLMQTDRYHERFGRRKEFPAFYSLPCFLTTWIYYILGGIFALVLLGVIGYRFLTDGTSGLGAVFGFPDP